jgi:hypothetical protein
VDVTTLDHLVAALSSDSIVSTRQHNPFSAGYVHRLNRNSPQHNRNEVESQIHVIRVEQLNKVLKSEKRSAPTSSSTEKPLLRRKGAVNIDIDFS